MSDVQLSPGGEAEQEPQRELLTPAEIEEKIKELTSDYPVEYVPSLFQRSTHAKDGTQVFINCRMDKAQERPLEFEVHRFYPDHTKTNPHKDERKWSASVHTKIADEESLKIISDTLGLLEANLAEEANTDVAAAKQRE